VILPDIYTPIVEDWQKLNNLLKNSKVPVIVYGDRPEHACFDRVSSDHEYGSASLPRYLIGTGCRES